MALNIKITIENRYLLQSGSNNPDIQNKTSKEKILQEAKEFAEKAKKSGKTTPAFTLKSGGTSSLGKMIKTKEQADFFMKMLNTLK